MLHAEQCLAQPQRQRQKRPPRARLLRPPLWHHEKVGFSVVVVPSHCWGDPLTWLLCTRSSCGA